MPEQFVKQNRSGYPDQLLCEARGLDALRVAVHGTDIDVPHVIQVDQQTLTMEYLRPTHGSAAQWITLGRGLASIHSKRQLRFGFHEDNYIGLNRQLNDFSDSWGSFFLKQRLEYQVGLVADPQWRRAFSKQLSHHARRVRDFLDGEGITPSLLHGDLWRGNVLCGEDGRVWLIDPAPYFGDAEADLAMTELFGGFPEDFYSAYRTARPASSNWLIKKPLYNLYHYLNHLNIFGHTYLEPCTAGFTALENI